MHVCIIWVVYSNKYVLIILDAAATVSECG